MPKQAKGYSVAKDALRKHIRSRSASADSKKLAELRLRYQDVAQPLTNYIRPMLANASGKIHPRMLPTQSSGRWSTFDPPLTNFSKKCISPDCPRQWHEKRDTCWSVRDCIMPEPGWWWYDVDLDAVEARIYALVVRDTQAVAAFNQGLDIHTPTACAIFSLPQPSNLANPHLAPEDEGWRKQVKWRGKDDQRRGISKNTRYGMQYALSYKAVLLLKDLEQFGLTQAEILRIGQSFWQLTAEQQKVKFALMAKVRKDKVVRSLYGARRVFFDTSDDTAKEGFNDIIQGTVVDYVNERIIKINRTYKESCLVHNAHDGVKIAFPLEMHSLEFVEELRGMFESEMTHNDLTVKITVTDKVVMPKEKGHV
jgi:DNA polymerase I-like protein with 3'-5' exonuclease and polymerase domains